MASALRSRVHAHKPSSARAPPNRVVGVPRAHPRGRQTAGYGVSGTAAGDRTRRRGRASTHRCGTVPDSHRVPLDTLWCLVIRPHVGAPHGGTDEPTALRGYPTARQLGECGSRRSTRVNSRVLLGHPTVHARPRTRAPTTSVASGFRRRRGRPLRSCRSC